MKNQSFTVVPVSKESVIKKAEVSAVFLIGFIGNKILAARNERGWDIPGGHLDREEELLDGLRRETEEEAGVSFENALPYAKLLVPNKDKYIIFFVSNSCTLGTFIPKSDALERDVLEIEILIERYYGNKNLLLDLIQKAKDLIA
ncbi:NUDIX domain-containing protein [Candidatus Azambacteria bacterium]|nr:NUDIX domain-containing protein [Candidatus Azambacteria bacterium]